MRIEDWPAFIRQRLTAPMREAKESELRKAQTRAGDAMEALEGGKSLAELTPLLVASLTIAPRQGGILMAVVEALRLPPLDAYELARAVDHESDKWTHKPDLDPSVDWSLGARTLLYIKSQYATFADAAGHYHEAYTVRRGILKNDRRDGSGARYHACAYELMVGNLSAVDKSLRRAEREQQTPDFWCWAHLLAQCLRPDGDRTAALAHAMDSEPDVAPHLLEASPPAIDFSAPYRAWSPESARHNAAILWLPWHVHHSAKRWLAHRMANWREA